MSATIHPPSHEIWFEAGERVFAGSTDITQYPPIDDPIAQRWWLGGFGSAWAASSGTLIADCAVRTALEIALEGRPDLHRQLLERGIQDAA